MRRGATECERDRLGQRVYVGFTQEELKKIDDWGFANRIRERSQVIRRLALGGLRAESAHADA